MKFNIDMPVIFNGAFATITGRDNGAELWIIEFCDRTDGGCRTVNESELSLDMESIDEDRELYETIASR